MSIYSKINELLKDDLDINNNVLKEMHYFRYTYDVSKMILFINNLCDHYDNLMNKQNNIKIDFNCLKKHSTCFIEKIEHYEKKIVSLTSSIDKLNSITNNQKKGIFESLQRDNDLQINQKKKKVMERELEKLNHKIQQHKIELNLFYDIENPFLSKKIQNIKIVIQWLLDIIDNYKMSFSEQIIFNRAIKII